MVNEKNFFIAADGKIRGSVDEATNSDVLITSDDEKFEVMLATITEEQIDQTIANFRDWTSDNGYDRKKFELDYCENENGALNVTIELGEPLSFNGRNADHIQEELNGIFDSYLIDKEELEEYKKPTEKKPDEKKSESKPDEKKAESKPDEKKAESKPDEKKPTTKDYDFTAEELKMDDPMKLADSFLKRHGY